MAAQPETTSTEQRRDCGNAIYCADLCANGGPCAKHLDPVTAKRAARQAAR